MLLNQDSHSAFSLLNQRIVACERCPHLRTYCAGIAEKRRRAYQHETYWGRPVRFAVSVVVFILIVPGFALSHGQGLIPVNGHQLFLNCAGNATGPTVILLSGGGGTTSTWDRIQPEVSKFARVCSYDRAGLGRSSKLLKAQSAEQIADDLRALLQQAKVPAPYVLVGHSIGGLYARSFDMHNDQFVCGMVLVDSSHEEQIWRFADEEPEALVEYPNWRDTDAMRAQGFLPAQDHLQWSFAKPLIVIEHGVPQEPVWHAMQEDLAHRSPRGRLISATRSTHYIQKIEPELVIDSIRAVSLTKEELEKKGVTKKWLKNGEIFISR